MNSITRKVPWRGGHIAAAGGASVGPWWKTRMGFVTTICSAGQPCPHPPARNWIASNPSIYIPPLSIRSMNIYIYATFLKSAFIAACMGLPRGTSPIRRYVVSDNERVQGIVAIVIVGSKYENWFFQGGMHELCFPVEIGGFVAQNIHI